MRTEKFSTLFEFAPKSRIKAGDGLEKGNFPFYTSSLILKKRIDKAQYFDEALVFGTGGSASVHFAGVPFATSTDCLVAMSKDKSLNVKYVYYYLFGNIHLLEQGFKGAGLKHISRGYIEEIDIPLLPIETQDKIVAILDKVSTLISKREETLQTLSEFLRATFLEMFQADLVRFRMSNTKLSDITTIVSGLTKGRKTKEKNLIEVPYLRVANTQDGYFNLEEIKTILATKNEIEQYSVKKNDLLITEGGDPDKLGRGAVWEGDSNKFIYQNHLFRLRIINPNEYSPYWLIQLIGSEFGKYYFLRQAKQTTGIATINKRQVSNFPIPKTSYDRQKSFEQRYLEIKSKNTVLLNSLNEFKIFFASILQKVFNGQLNFNIDFELDALLREIDLQKRENDVSNIIRDVAYLQRLVDKLNAQEFKEKDLYDKAKHVIFQLMTNKGGKKITQIYNEKSKSVELTLP